MTDETQLRLQIQQEIDREAKIDRMIESKVKKILKENRQFYQVQKRKGCDAVLIYFRDDLSRFHIKLYSELNDSFDLIERLERATCVYIKNKNTHDNRLHTFSFIKGSTPFKDFGK